MIAVARVRRRAWLLLLAAHASFLTVAARAQEPPRTPPEPLPLTPAPFPPFQEATLPNGVRVLVVPGSQQVKRQAEAEGLDRVFREAGAEWREPGCSMCIAMNGDRLEPGRYAVSTSNRNFEGRQGPGGRTFLASPLTAAASALRGCIADPRERL